MGILDITLGEEDQNWLVGAALAPFTGGMSLAMAQQNNSQMRMQKNAQKDQADAIEKARYDAALNSLSARIQADSVISTEAGRGRNTNQGVDTSQGLGQSNSGSSTSGTF